ncbi:MAG TPA: hypothetical protein VFW11_08325 [Cyclobacteriaceae bacterium]|nr:hypothetical protein [Cyclobacteriaceae bacterium]
MAKYNSINPFSRVNNDTGFGTRDNYGGRFINRDGTFNIRKTGQGFWQRLSIFQSMLSLPTWKFIIVLFASFISINIFFTLIYLVVGADQFVGMMSHNKWSEI